MARFTQLSIDLMGELLETGIVPASKRMKRFVEKAFHVPRQRRFIAPWMRNGELLVEGGADHGGPYLRLALLPDAASSGDRIVLEASVDPVEEEDPNGRRKLEEEGYATLYDGAGLFVLHVLDRADPLMRERLAGMRPPTESAEVTDPEHRQAWRSLRDDLLATFVEHEVRGPVSIYALAAVLGTNGVDVALLDDSDEILPALDVATEILDARKVPRQRRRGGTASADLAFKFDGRRGYDPENDARALLTLLARSRETFGPSLQEFEHERVVRMLREASRGGTTRMPRLAR